MKNFLFSLIIISFLLPDSYSWEDGGTILGSSGNISNPLNTGSLNGVEPYDGDYMLSVSESPLSGTPKAYVAYIQNLLPGDVVTASFYTYDSFDGSPSARIWGSYASNTDINSYEGSAGGNESYPTGTGWEQLSHTWTIDADHEALVVEARLYSSSSGPDPTEFYFDLISVTAPDTATINFPGDLGDLIPGCTDSDACNYDSEATANDGSCLYDDCLGECGGMAEVDVCGVCEGDGSTCDSVALFFSEYAEGSSNNKYLEIYNPGSESVDLSGYAFPSVANAPTTPGEHEYWNTFDAGTTVEPGDIYVICHGSADASIQTECDQEHTYLSNGNDGMCLVFGTESSYEILDCIGDWNADPGLGWDVAGVSNGTLDHTLVRKASITSGTSNWASSAGTNADDSQWIVFDIDTWTYIGSHPHDFVVEGCTDPLASNYDPDATLDDGTCDYSIPVADAGDDQSVDFGALVTLSGNGSDDGNIIGYLWTQTGGPDVTLSSYEEQTVTFTAPDQFCTLTFSLQVIDNDANFSDYDNISIFVGNYTIHDIQFTEDQGAYCYETLMTEESVTVSGIVTHVKPGSSNFFLQDPNEDDLWSGIYVYDTSVNPIVGDELSVTATVNEYYSLTQLIDVTSFSLLSSGNTIYPLNINASDLGIECSLSGEQYESMLVAIEDVSFDSVDEFGNWTVSDGLGGITMIDDYYYDGSWPTIVEGSSYDCISGVVSYSYSEFKVYPRNISDFSCYDSSCEGDGDVNGDASVDVLDVVSIVSFVIGNGSFNDAQICASDVNEDGSVDVLDIVSIVNGILS